MPRSTAALLAPDPAEVGGVQHFLGGLVEDAAVDGGLAVRVGAEQRAIAQQVDPARHPARIAEDAPQRALIEGTGVAQARHGQPVAHVVRGLLLRQRLEVVTGDHALRELLHVGPRQHGAQLGLPDQDDLQQLALVGLEVGQQAQLLQHAGRQVLRLVDDQHVVLPHGVRAQQELVERVDVVLDGRHARPLVPVGNVELRAHGLQQFLDRELGIEDVGHVAAIGQLLEEAAAHGGLAGADVAGQKHEPSPALHAVEKMRERFPVPLAHEEVARIGRDREGPLLQAEVALVHGRQGYWPRAHRVCVGGGWMGGTAASLSTGRPQSSGPDCKGQSRTAYDAPRASQPSIRTAAAAIQLPATRTAMRGQPTGRTARRPASCMSMQISLPRPVVDPPTRCTGSIGRLIVVEK